MSHAGRERGSSFAWGTHSVYQLPCLAVPWSVADHVCGNFLVVYGLVSGQRYYYIDNTCFNQNAMTKPCCSFCTGTSRSEN